MKAEFVACFEAIIQTNWLRTLFQYFSQQYRQATENLL